MQRDLQTIILNLPNSLKLAPYVTSALLYFCRPFLNSFPLFFSFPSAPTILRQILFSIRISKIVNSFFAKNTPLYDILHNWTNVFNCHCKFNLATK